MQNTLELTPRAIAAELDKYIVGQGNAKRAVAIAMRNRYRRERVGDDLRSEIIPKNILMIGPTGVGKTEIARRLAALAGAPFVKVEATKYTEVGYVGRDVESMVRDLAEHAVRMVTDERREEVKDAAARMAVERVVDLLHPETRPPAPPGQGNAFAATLGSIFGGNFGQQQQPSQPAPAPAAAEHGRGARSRTSPCRRRARVLRRSSCRARHRRVPKRTDRHAGRHRSERRRRRSRAKCSAASFRKRKCTSA